MIFCCVESKDDKLYSHIPSWQLRDTLPFPHCLLIFSHCSYKMYSHSLIAVQRHTHIPHCSLTFIAVIRHTRILSLQLLDTLISPVAHSHSLIAVIRHTHIPSLQL